MSSEPLTLEELDRQSQDITHKITLLFADSFSTLCASIDKKFQNQKDGRPRSISQTGEPYVVIKYSVPFRESELGERVAREHAAMQVSALLEAYSDDKDGVLYWRNYPEDAVEEFQVVGAYDDNGPAKDFFTGRRCHVESGWRLYSIYMRLLISNKPELPEKRGEA